MIEAANARATFISVARCENVKLCLETTEAHPCREIVEYQVLARGVKDYDDFQLPEPWVGELDSARILFVSSNPSIGDDNHAFGASTDEALWDSHHLAFGGGTRNYILDGIYTTAPSGERLQKVAYWVAVRARARELIPEAIPGRDYALTEVVHCKSKDEIGVFSASAECTSKHLNRVLALSPARVLIVLGKAARERIQGAGCGSAPQVEERDLGGLSRLIAYLPHPASFARVPRTLAGLYADDLLRLQDATTLARTTPTVARYLTDPSLSI